MVVCREIDGAPYPQKKLNSTPKDKHGTIEKRKRKTQGICEDDDTEVC